MFNDTVTIFNRQSSRSGSIWYPTVLHNVNLNIDKSAIIAKYGANSNDAAILNVHFQKDGPDIYVDGKIWKPPVEWTNSIDKASVVTFASGQQFDFFWFGEWPDTNPVDDSDCGDNFYQYMKDNYDFVFAITAVGGPYTVIPHFEIMGR